MLAGLHILKLNGKFYFNGELYRDLYGAEKQFVDSTLAELKAIDFDKPRIKNPNLKFYNYQFKT